MKPTPIDLNDFEKISSRLGSNLGAFFKKKTDGSEYYIKWRAGDDDSKNIDQFKNEYLALKLYDLFDVAVPKAQLCTFTDENAATHIGIITTKKEGIGEIRSLYEDKNQTRFNYVREKAQQDFIIDTLLGNYDVVGLGMDNLHYDTNTYEPFRIDPGGALRYKAQGDKKNKGQFDNSVAEFEEMENGENTLTQYNPTVLKQASLVFNGAHKANKLQVGLAKLLAISDEQIKDCVNDNYHNTDTPEGRAANETMIKTLLDRKYTLIQKAETKIAIQNASTLSTIDSKEQFLQVNTKAELIRNINNDEILPQIAIQHYPQDADVVAAAYKKNSLSIKYAHKDIINTLGEKKILHIDDVLDAFSKTKPSLEEIKKTTNDFDAALANKNWAKVVEICDLFWFEKPENATKKHVSNQLINNDNSGKLSWEDFFDFEKAEKKTTKFLIAGPLFKTKETYLLEELTRKMMLENNFLVKTMDSEDYFIFPDGAQFNWTKIRAHADLQHIDFDKADFVKYQQFMQSRTLVPFDKSELDPNKESQYQSELYTHYTQHNIPLPESPISFSEMQAINIYTGGFYTTMNALMRDTKDQFYPCNAQEIRNALIHSVMCASGLRKIPTTEIDVSYRGADYDNSQTQQKRVETAAKNGIIKLEGFVSSGIVEDAAFSKKSLLYTFKNLRGAYIAPISTAPKEEEFLIHPTQVQLTNYGFNESKKQHQFSGSLVSALEIENDGKFIPNLIERNTLRFAEPETIIALINSNTENMYCFNAVQTFPENKDIISAAYHKNIFSIRNAEPSSIIQLMEDIIAPKDAITAFPENREIITTAYKKEPYAIFCANPSIIAQLTSEEIISPQDAINAFPQNEEVIKAIYDKAPSVFYEELNQGNISTQQAAKIFPQDENISAICYKHDSTNLQYASALTVISLVKNGTVFPEEAVKTFSKNKEIVACAYALDRESLRYADTFIIGQLINEMTIPPQTSNYFLNDDQLIGQTSYCTRLNLTESFYQYLSKESLLKEIITLTTIISDKEKNYNNGSTEIIVGSYNNGVINYDSENLQKAMIKLINNDILSVEQIAQHCDDEKIVTAAYNKDPHSIHYMGTFNLYTLHVNGVISFEDALKFSDDKVNLLKFIFVNNQDIIIEHSALISDLIKKTPSLAIDIIKEFKSDDDIISIIYKENPEVICHANTKAIIRLINSGEISTQDGKAAFPNNAQVTQACCKKEMNNINQSEPSENIPNLIPLSNIQK